MPKKKHMKKAKMKSQNTKKAKLKSWILGNNPDDNNKCQCFNKRLPNARWIAINSFSTHADCAQFVNDCSNFFMMMPLVAKKPSKKMMLQGERHMGMMMG